MSAMYVRAVRRFGERDAGRALRGARDDGRLDAGIVHERFDARLAGIINEPDGGRFADVRDRALVRDPEDRDLRAHFGVPKVLGFLRMATVAPSFTSRASAMVRGSNPTRRASSMR